MLATRLLRSASASSSNRRPSIQYSVPWLGPEESNAVADTVASGRLVMGPATRKFEQRVADLAGQKHAIAVTSGTTALQLAMNGMGVDSNFVGVTPSYTWVATYNAVRMVNAECTIADVNSRTFCMDPQSAERQIQKIFKQHEQHKDKKTLAVPVHLFGERCPNPNGFDVILGDGCCAFAGKDSDNSTCGKWNPVECVSFHPRKLITTGEGGMVLCSDDELAHKLRLLRDHGAFRSDEQRRQTTQGGDMTPDFIVAGYNYRLTEMQGAMGNAQMDKLDTIIEVRRNVAAAYDAHLDGLQNDQADMYLRLPPAEKPGARRVLTMYAVQLRSRLLDELEAEILVTDEDKRHAIAERVVSEVRRLNGERKKIMEQLVGEGVIVRPPMISLLDVLHIQQEHMDRTGHDLRQDVTKASLFPGTYITSNLTFGLPLHALLTKEDTERVIDRVRRAIRPPFVDRALSASQARPQDFSIQYPVRREYFQDSFKIPSASSSPSSPALYSSPASSLPSPTDLVKNRDMLLYLHVPFCASKCHYCNFSVDTRKSPEIHSTYANVLSSLTQKWVHHINDASNNVRVEGIDIGGGTPTLLSESLLSTILQPLKPLVAQHRKHASNASTYLSIESTPSIAATQPSKLKMMVEHGVNRISIGVQSTNAELLSQVNRKAQIDTEVVAIRNMRDAGFERISTDVIFALPGQSMADWQQDLKILTDLQPDSITTYDCLYRGKGRAMSTKLAASADPSIPSPETYGRMYDYAYEFLTKNGYFAPYGSVNFAKRLEESGTSSYFEGRLLGGKSYLGLGNYATSLFDRFWWFAPYSVDSYLDAVCDGNGNLRSNALDSWSVGDAYDLPVQERAAKHVLLSLSFGHLDEAKFEAAFPGWHLQDLFSASLTELVEKRKWMRYDSNARRFYIQHGCFQYLPQIRSLFYSEQCMKWYEFAIRAAKSK